MADLKHIAEELRRIADELEKGADPLDAVVTNAEPEQRDTVPIPPVKTTYTAVAKAFKVRYESARQMEWFVPRNTQDCIDLADWIDGQAERDHRPPKDVGAQLLNNFFSDPKIKQGGYPIAWLAKDPGRFYRPTTEDGEPTDEERRRRRQEAERRYQEAKAEAETKHTQEVRQRASELQQGPPEPPKPRLVRK